MSKNKKIVLVIVCVLISVPLLAYSISHNNQGAQNDSTYEISYEADSEASAENNESTSDTSKENPSDATDEKDEQSEESSGTTSKGSNNASKEKETTATSKTAEGSITKATTRTTTTTSSYISCTVEIEYSKALKYIDEPEDENGVMLSTYSVTLENGATAYDALSKACSENGISINQKSTMYGTYIAGINGINEKDYGSGSGWLYSVNGTYPQKACSSYTLSSGDRIAFRYTCG